MTSTPGKAAQNPPDPKLYPVKVTGAANVDTSDVEAGIARPDPLRFLVLIL